MEMDPTVVKKMMEMKMDHTVTGSPATNKLRSHGRMGGYGHKGCTLLLILAVLATP